MSKQITTTEKENENNRALLFNYLSNMYENLAINIFKWSNLPDGITSQRIEKRLYISGSGVFVKDKQFNYLFLNYTNNNGLNIYDEPTAWKVFGGNAYNKSFNIDNSILVRNNFNFQPSKDFVDFNILKLINIEETIQNNLNANKTPFIFSGNEKEILTLKNTYAKVSGNIPIIYCDKSFNLQNLEVFKSQADYICDKLVSLYNVYESRILNFIGINSLNIEKKERLITSEVEGNQEFINANFNAMKESRLIAVDEINKMFGLNVKCDINQEILVENTKKEEVTDDNI